MGYIMGRKNGLSASLEDYIEAIFCILAKKKAVRAKDIAERMNVSRPSVTGALQALVKEGMVNHEPYDVITLTDAGRKAASDVVSRHEVLQDFLVSVLNVEEEEAASAACAMEHAVPKKIVDKLVKFVENMKDKKQ